MYNKPFFIRLFLVVFFATSFSILKSQNLFQPREIQKAFHNGTRSLSGEPGKNYWQNTARYDISLEVAPPSRNIVGSEKIIYFNNSPDTLKSLTTRLFLNIHKPGAPRDGGASQAYLSKGTTIDYLEVNGKEQKWDQNPRYFTVEPFRLKTPLAPHDSIELVFKWHSEISIQSGREGMIDSTTYFLAYFYPRISVYDDYEGWDRVPFVDSKEFYSDFNDYTVHIKTPKNFIVWGTGTLLNPEKVLSASTLKSYLESMNSGEIISLAKEKELKAGTVLLPGEHIWEFTAKHIPDMTFGISDHFNWDISSEEVDPITHRRASVQAAYNDTAADFHHMVSFAKHSLNWFSNHWPGVPYPYEKTTIFQGYADMEYPMMVNDSSTPDTLFSRFVVEHELAHTYMPFYMGINETRYGFMDEGWATTFELLIGREDLGIEKAEENYKEFRTGFMDDLSSDEQLPIITPGTSMTGRGLGSNEYGKSSLGYFALKDLLGDSQFKICLRAYMARWHGKHPIPWDFFNTFSNISHKNLDWFWNAWFFSPTYIDMAIGTVKHQPGGYSIALENIGGMPAPTNLEVKFTDGTTQNYHQGTGIWEKNLHHFSFPIKTLKTIASLHLEGGIFTDGDPKNNNWVKP